MLGELLGSLATLAVATVMGALFARLAREVFEWTR